MGKTYVKVIAEFNEDGAIRPLEIVWSDGQRYKITHVSEVCRAASTKAGGTGYRYKITIEGKERYMWLEDVVFNKTIGARWFVESN